MKNSQADAIRWLRQAEHDLGIAELALREGYFAHACFMSQQVAEKALKALAYHRGDRHVFGHSLVELLSQLKDTYPQLADTQKLLNILERYYITTRYPDALPGSIPYEIYDREEAVEAVEDAAGIVEMARNIIMEDTEKQS